MAIEYTTRIGRPIEFSKKDHENIVEGYKKTLTLAIVAGLAERDTETIKGWLKRGREHYVEGKDTELAQFFKDVKKAQAETLMRREAMLENGVDAWQRIAWLLERTCRESYGADAGIIEELKQEFEDIKAKMEKQG